MLSFLMRFLSFSEGFSRFFEAVAAMLEEQREETSLPAPHASPRRVTAALLAELLDLSPDALVVINQAGTLVMANDQAAALFGYRLQDVLGQPLEGLSACISCWGQRSLFPWPL